MNYSFKDYEPSKMARAIFIGSPISRKFGVEVCNAIRNKPLEQAKKTLISVIEKKKALPFRRYIWDLGHKRKIGAGRYPTKTSKEILKLIESVEANAQFKGLNTSKLFIRHICANKGITALHYGRKTRRKMKRTNIEVVVEER